MKRLMSLFLAVIMIFGTTTEVFATQSIEGTSKETGNYRSIGIAPTLDEDFWFGNIIPTSITPTGEKRHEYRFYGSKNDAELAQGGTTGIVPLNVKFVRTGSKLEKRELIEQKDQLFKGWFYMEDGVEKSVPFGAQGWIGEDKTFYAYPKRDDVIAVFFAHGSVVHKSASPDPNGYVSINDQPGVGEAGKVLKGWSMDKSFATVAEAKAAGKLFHFKEDDEPTLVTGTLMLHAIFEDAIRISFDTHGAKVIAGKNIKSGDEVAVPDLSEVKKEGYTFDYWYVLEDDETSTTGQKEVKLTIKDKQGVKYFDYQFKKDTIVNVKWRGQEVPFNIVFMIEKRPDQIVEGGEKYSFLGSFNNKTDTNLQITKGIAGSQIVFDNEDTSASPSKVTSLDKDQFKSYLKEDNNTKNLLKYADSIGVNADSLKGFHVNKEETNKKNPIIEGNGLTTKVVYLDRDTVNVRVIKNYEYVKDASGNTVISQDETGANIITIKTEILDDESQHPDALGQFKYGQTLLEKKENRGWKYLFNNYIKTKENYQENQNEWRNLGNYSSARKIKRWNPTKRKWESVYINNGYRIIFTAPPMAVEQVKNGEYTVDYMKRNESKDAWTFDFYLRKKKKGHVVLSIPLRLPIDQQEIDYNQALEWIKQGGGR